MDELPGYVVTPPPRKRLRLRHGIVVVVLFALGQFATWIAALLVTGVRDAGPRDRAITDAMLHAFPVALPASVVLGALVVALYATWLVRRCGLDARTQFGLLGASFRAQRRAAIAGLVVGVLLVALASQVDLPAPREHGLLAQALNSSRASRIAFGVTAVLLAPVVEEFVFRGVLMGILLPVTGPVLAGSLSGIVFWLLHATEWVRYWPAAVGIGLMTVLVTLLRLRAGSIRPGIWAHLCYNGALTLVAALP